MVIDFRAPCAAVPMMTFPESPRLAVTQRRWRTKSLTAVIRRCRSCFPRHIGAIALCAQSHFDLPLMERMCVWRRSSSE